MSQLDVTAGCHRSQSHENVTAGCARSQPKDMTEGCHKKMSRQNITAGFDGMMSQQRVTPVSHSRMTP